MIKFATMFVLIALFATAARAAEPVTSGPPIKARPSGANRAGSYFERAAVITAERRATIRDMVELLAVPEPRIGQFVLERIDVKYRLMRLVNESVDLRQAREAAHRFWMNNQDKVQTYRPNGNVGR